jgi:hypothetical protein
MQIAARRRHVSVAKRGLDFRQGGAALERMSAQAFMRRFGTK